MKYTEDDLKKELETKNMSMVFILILNLTLFQKG